MSPASPTTTVPAVPDLTSYRAVHRAIRQGAHRLAIATGEMVASDTARVKAVRRYWQGYAGEVLAHHTVEDTVFFPALAARLPSMTELFEQLDAEHHQLDEHMAEIVATLGSLDRVGGPSRAARALSALAATMDAHLDLEDEFVLPTFVDLFTVEEYLAMEQQAIEQIGIGRQAAFTVPFVLSAAGADADTMLATAPLPFRVLHSLTKRRHARLSAMAFGPLTPLAPVATFAAASTEAVAS